jgi:hypothetical protein
MAESREFWNQRHIHPLVLRPTHAAFTHSSDCSSGHHVQRNARDRTGIDDVSEDSGASPIWSGWFEPNEASHSNNRSRRTFDYNIMNYRIMIL